MSTIWNITHNQMHHKVLEKLSIFVSGFLSKIINKFLGIIRMFRGKKETNGVCASPIDHDLNLGLLSEADHKKEHDESSNNFIQLQRAAKGEEPEAPEKPLIQPEVKREYIFCGYCYSGKHKAKFCPKKEYICRDCGTLFPCEKNDVHGSEEHKVLNYCFDCKKWGHLPESCPEKDESDVTFDDTF